MAHWIGPKVREGEESIGNLQINTGNGNILQAYRAPRMLYKKRSASPTKKGSFEAKLMKCRKSFANRLIICVAAPSIKVNISSWQSGAVVFRGSSYREKPTRVACEVDLRTQGKNVLRYERAAEALIKCPSPSKCL